MQSESNQQHQPGNRTNQQQHQSHYQPFQRTHPQPTHLRQNQQAETSSTFIHSGQNERGDLNTNSTTIYRSQVWPPSGSDAGIEHRAYHPSITERNPIERENLLRPTNITASSSVVNESTVPQWQLQQQMTKHFANRKYDGSTTDAKTLSTREFIGRLRSMIEAMGTTDTKVLSLLDTVVTGTAYDWWTTRRYYIHSLDELEMQVNIRFEKRKMDSLSQKMAFVSRKQSTDESAEEFEEKQAELDSTV